MLLIITICLVELHQHTFAWITGALAGALSIVLIGLELKDRNNRRKVYPTMSDEIAQPQTYDEMTEEYTTTDT